MHPIHTFFHWVVWVLFVLFALLQLNDDGAWPWIIGYGWVSIVAAMKLFKQIQPKKQTIKNLTLISLIVYLAWAGFWFPEVLVWIDLGTPSITSGMSAETPYIEYVREFFGLIICASTMAYLTISESKNDEQ